jgi:hypothetical protein
LATILGFMFFVERVCNNRRTTDLHFARIIIYYHRTGVIVGQYTVIGIKFHKKLLVQSGLIGSIRF